MVQTSPGIGSAAVAAPSPPERSSFQRAARTLARSKGAVFGLVVVTGLLLIAAAMIARDAAAQPALADTNADKYLPV